MVAAGLAALAFVVVSFVVVTALNVSGTRRSLLRQQIEGFAPRTSAQGKPAVEVLRTERPPVFRSLEKLVGGSSAAENISLEMMRADLPLRPGEYVAIRIATAVVLFVLVAYATGTFLIGVPMLPLSYIAIGFFVKRRQQSRLSVFEKQLPEAIDLLNTALKSGFGLLQGLETVAREMPRPIKDEFSQIIRDVSVGMQLEDALQAMSVRVNSYDAYLLVTAVTVHRTVGGNLAEVLAGIARTTRARLHMRDEVRALTTTPRVSSYVVSALPFGVFGLMYLLNPSYISLLFTTGIGRVMLVVGGVLMAAGLLISNRLMQLDY